MSPSDIRAKAAWLYDLTGLECAWPIQIALDLREYALTIANCCADELTGAEARQVSELIKSLELPAMSASKGCQSGAQANGHSANYPIQITDDVRKIIDEWEALEAKDEQRKAVLVANSVVKKQNGEITRRKIIKLWNTLQLPEINRATFIAQRLRITSQHVRRILAAEGLK
jgi:hypothetical protein